MLPPPPLERDFCSPPVSLHFFSQICSKKVDKSIVIETYLVLMLKPGGGAFFFFFFWDNLWEGVWRKAWGLGFFPKTLFIDNPPFLSSGKIIQKIIKLMTRGSWDKSFVWCWRRSNPMTVGYFFFFFGKMCSLLSRVYHSIHSASIIQILEKKIKIKICHVKIYI